MGYLFENMEHMSLQEERRKTEEERRKTEMAEERLRILEEKLQAAEEMIRQYKNGGLYLSQRHMAWGEEAAQKAEQEGK